jgi:predicted RNA-binding Zn-ribbon protein involved in translation (DUF1610 family)
MSIDYDAPRPSSNDEESVEQLEELRAVSATRAAQRPDVEQDEAEAADTFELPGADLSGEELTVKVLPKQADEFTCASCFLVHHRSRLAQSQGTQYICRDCAA